MGDPPIVVTGGSVTIEFDEGTIKREAKGRHHSNDKKISRVEVFDEKNQKLFDQQFPNGKLLVKIHIG